MEPMLLASNARVSVMPDDTVEVVSLDGSATSVPGSDAAPAISAYVEKYWPGEDPEPHAAFLLSHSVYRVDPNKAYGIIEREDEFASKATRWRWT